MKRLDRLHLKLLALEAAGHFSYLTWKGFRFTVISSKWCSGDLVVVELPAEAYVKRIAYNEKINELLTISTQINALLPRLEFEELEALRARYASILESISLRYEVPSKD